MPRQTASALRLQRVDTVSLDIKSELPVVLRRRDAPPNGHGRTLGDRPRNPVGCLGSQHEPLTRTGAHQDEGRQLVGPRELPRLYLPLDPKPNSGRCEVGVTHRTLKRRCIWVTARIKRDGDQPAFEVVFRVVNAFQAL